MYFGCNAQGYAKVMQNGMHFCIAYAMQKLCKSYAKHYT